MNDVPVSWAIGTAYDLFASLFVIQNADSTGLRKAWAAGVRNRLGPENRDLLRVMVPLVGVPAEWIGTLGEKPPASAVLDELARMADERIIPALVDRDFLAKPVVKRVMENGSLTAADVAEYVDDCATCPQSTTTEEAARELLGILSRPAESGRAVAEAYREYFERFFGEEELRIAPHLENAFSSARERAAGCSTVDLVDELTGGLRLEDLRKAAGLLLIPSFWAGPLTLFMMYDDGPWVLLFSARPRDVSLIPGDPVPDALSRSLSAVSDHTRLRMLKLIAAEPRTQVEIARELRLRPPTITHHLKILRLANLIRLTETEEGEKRYSVRGNRLPELMEDLIRFVSASNG